MTAFERGDIVLVPFDFTDGTGRKWRPAVIISSTRYLEESPDAIIASITSNLQAMAHPGDQPIREWQEAGLLKPSLAQTKVATVEAGQIGRRLGRLAAADLAALTRGLKEALDL